MEPGEMMTRRHLATSGWLAMASAVLTIPWFFLTIVLADRGGALFIYAQGGMLAFGTVLLVYLLITLRRLLHENYAFHAADEVISFLVGINIAAAAVGLLELAVPSLEKAAEVISIVLIVAVGIMQIMFGIKLLLLSDDLKGLHKPYCYLNIITGFCLATVVLLPAGIVASAVTDVMLGTIFFQYAKQHEN
jgi:hypothetical protein